MTTPTTFFRSLLALAKPSSILVLSALFIGLSATAQLSPSLTFDGENDEIRVPNTALNTMGSGDFTVEAWVRGSEEDQGLHARIFSNRQGLMTHGFLFHFVSWPSQSDYMMLTASYGTNNFFMLDNGTFDGPILDGNCHHVAITRVGGQMTFYVDGQVIGTKSGVSTAPTAQTGNSQMVIGNCDRDPYPFDGTISDVRIWNQGRTQEEIQSTMEISIVDPQAGLLANYLLQEGEGQLITDAASSDIGFLGGSEFADSMDPQWSEEGCLSMSTGIDDLTDTQAISSYPNPTADLLTFDIGERRLTSIEVIDMSGRRVLAARPSSTGRVAMSVAALDQGAYIALITTDQGRMTTRFVKE